MMPRFFVCDYSGKRSRPCIFSERSWLRLHEGNGDLKRCIKHGSLITGEEEAESKEALRKSMDEAQERYDKEHYGC